MAGINMNSYKDLYLKTAGEHLTTLSNNIVVLKENKNNAIALELLHRCSHSLKSQSLIMGYLTLGELAKTLELFFKQIIESKNIISTEHINLIYETIPRMQKSLEHIKRENTEIDLSGDIKKFDSLAIGSNYESTSS